MKCLQWSRSQRAGFFAWWGECLHPSWGGVRQFDATSGRSGQAHFHSGSGDHVLTIVCLPNPASRTERTTTGLAAWRLYEWYFGAPPQAAGTIGLIDRPIWLLILGIHMAGPDLTPETFRDGLFAYPPTGGTPLTPRSPSATTASSPTRTTLQPTICS